MRPLSRRQALISTAGLAVACGLGGLALAFSHAGFAAPGAHRSLGLALALLAALATTAVAGLALFLHLLARTDELRLANQALGERNRELELTSKAKTRFVANLSHELRNPLSAVIGYAELMASGRFGTLDERQHEHLGVIRESGEHLLSLIEELQDMARVEAGHLHLESAPVDPAAVIRGCAAALRMMADRREVQIEIDAPAGARVMLDPTRLRQVVLNYVSNAIKFSPRAGMVAVRLRHEGGGIRVEVSDDGPGLSAGDQARVFEEFFQVPGSDRSGTGLGLAVTRRIVETQGGQVGVRSQPGIGSTFAAWWPATEIGAALELARPPRPVSIDSSGPLAPDRQSAGALGVS
jgi:signal transduction histidine kinase